MARQFWIRNWFLVCLLVALIGGSVFHTHLKWAEGTDAFRWTIVAITMFLIAWPLRFDSIVQVVKKPIAPLYACLLNVGLVPLIAWPLSMLLHRELGIGLLVAAATPSTLASGAVWTRKAGGNDVVAMIVSIVTNASCFLTLPFWLWLTTDSGQTQISFGPIGLKLLLLVFLPILIAQLTRAHRPVAKWASDHKVHLGIFAQIGVLMIVFMGAIQTGHRMSEMDLGQKVGEFGLGLVIVTGIHCAVLALGYYSSIYLGINRADRIAVGFSASQKTLMIGLTTCLELGVSIMPIIAYHAMQLIVDTFVAKAMARDAAIKSDPDPLDEITDTN